MSEAPTVAEQDHLTLIASLACVLCARMEKRTWPVHVHHIREGRGMAQRSVHFLTIPLCPECHQGQNGIHGNRSLLYINKIGEIDLLGDTMALISAKLQEQGTYL
jgi:hypothetical protein